jgi:hypothetical protein
MGGEHAAFCDANIMAIGGGLASVAGAQNDAKSSGIHRRFGDSFHTDCGWIEDDESGPSEYLSRRRLSVRAKTRIQHH